MTDASSLWSLQVDWQLLLLHKLANMYDQPSTSSLLVYDLRRIDGHVRLGWVNDTISTHRCDKLALAQVASVSPLTAVVGYVRSQTPVVALYRLYCWVQSDILFKMEAPCSQNSCDA